MGQATQNISFAGFACKAYILVPDPGRFGSGTKRTPSSRRLEGVRFVA